MVGFQRFYNRINSSEDLTVNLAVTSGRETNPFDDYGIERPIAPIVHLTLGANLGSAPWNLLSWVGSSKMPLRLRGDNSKLCYTVGS